MIICIMMWYIAGLCMSATHCLLVWENARDDDQVFVSEIIF